MHSNSSGTQVEICPVMFLKSGLFRQANPENVCETLKQQVILEGLTLFRSHSPWINLHSNV